MDWIGSILPIEEWMIFYTPVPNVNIHLSAVFVNRAWESILGIVLVVWFYFLFYFFRIFTFFTFQYLNILKNYCGSLKGCISVVVLYSHYQIFVSIWQKNGLKLTIILFIAVIPGTIYLPAKVVIVTGLHNSITANRSHEIQHTGPQP